MLADIPDFFTECEPPDLPEGAYYLRIEARGAEYVYHIRDDVPGWSYTDMLDEAAEFAGADGFGDINIMTRDGTTRVVAYVRRGDWFVP